MTVVTIGAEIQKLQAIVSTVIADNLDDEEREAMGFALMSDHAEPLTFERSIVLDVIHLGPFAEWSDVPNVLAVREYADRLRGVDVGLCL